MKQFNDLASVTRIHFNYTKLSLFLKNILLELQKIFRHFTRTELLEIMKIISLIYTIKQI